MRPQPNGITFTLFQGLKLSSCEMYIPCACNTKTYFHTCTNSNQALAFTVTKCSASAPITHPLMLHSECRLLNVSLCSYGPFILACPGPKVNPLH